MLEQVKSISRTSWKESYWNHVKRNIGYITFEEQEILRTTPIAVLGVGGLGGPLAEQLVRCGCENLILCDNDMFEESNLNRQVCNRADLGEIKVRSVKEKLLNINPVVNIEIFEEVSEENVIEMVGNVKVVALTLDDPISSILIARTCRNLSIPMLETWAIPYLCAWWFTPDSMDYESCYELNTHELSIDEMRTSETLRMNVVEALIPKVLKFPGMAEMFDRERGTLKKMMAREIPLRSLAP
ncbi:MAG: HesA/MoeB/ThiF family protein, partial [Candidatus Helarchaeota archaeon]